MSGVAQPMPALALAFLAWTLGGAGAWLLRRRVAGQVVGSTGAVIGGVAAAISATSTLVRPTTILTWRTAWSVPAGALVFHLDALAAVFLLPVAVIGACCAVYGVAYLRHDARPARAGRHGGTPSRPRAVPAAPIGTALAMYNLLLLSMAALVTAGDYVLLLVAWELMTLSSWALVVSDHEQKTVRAAGLQYLIASHLSTAALFLFILVVGSASGGSFAMTALVPAAAGAHPALPPLAPLLSLGTLFVLALVGFGTKAAIMPFHVWLPDAHPAAPSHVSALMSAVMITMGFYGLARVVSLLGSPALWWGYLLMAVGVAGAVGGVLHAVAQRDVKRVLAFSTIENAGLATLGMGLGLVATALDQPALAGLAWTAALLHLWNHALAKALLFLGFGAVAQRAETRSIDALGGVLRRWPVAAALMLLGAAAMASIPGLNVFTSEWLLLRGLFTGTLALAGPAQGIAVAGIGAVALVGGVAVACFVRLTGIALLGTPRARDTADALASAPEPGWAMRLPLVILAGLCVLIAVDPGAPGAALAAAVHVVAPAAETAAAEAALAPLALIVPLVGGTLLLVIALRALASLVRRLRSAHLTMRGANGDIGRRGPTWGCGYSLPTSAMQYTGTSFGEPLTRLVEPLLGTTVRATIEPILPADRAGPDAPAVVSLWPRAARWTAATTDRVLGDVYEPLFDRIAQLTTRLQPWRGTRVTTALRYIVLTVVVLLALLAGVASHAR